MYEYSGARMKFQNGADGDISRAIRSRTTPPWDIFRITCIDDSASSSVSARLVSVDECSGAEEDAYSYYIEATVSRSSIAVDPALIMMSLSH